MLAQNFMTAADLGITEPQRDALIKTLALMDGGKLVHVPRFSFLEGKELGFCGQFNMSDWGSSGSCGSVCCIGGTAELVGDLPELSLHLLSQELRSRGRDQLWQLFYVGGMSDRKLSDITVPQAAIALRSYLTIGDARWDLALAAT